MQITVKSTKIAKTGTNKSGDWELVLVTSDDGTDYATFHKNAKNLIAGTVIDIGEPKIEKGKCSFKEYEIVSAPAETPPAGTSKSDMTPEMWAEKDRIERWSFEAQVAYKGIVELVKTIYSTDKEIPDELKKVYDVALNWALAHFQTSNPTPTKPVWQATKPTQEATEPEPIDWGSNEEKITTPELLSWVAEANSWKNTSACRSWLVNKCKIDEDRIDNDPQGVYDEVKQLI